MNESKAVMKQAHGVLMRLSGYLGQRKEHEDRRRGRESPVAAKSPTQPGQEKADLRHCQQRLDELKRELDFVRDYENTARFAVEKCLQRYQQQTEHAAGLGRTQKNMLLHTSPALLLDRTPDENSAGLRSFEISKERIMQVHSFGCVNEKM